mgnify:CR=1 FL=1
MLRILETLLQKHHSSKPVFQRSRHCAVVADEIKPGQTGRIKLFGAWWRAELENQNVPRNFSIKPGEEVAILSRRNNTLLVGPLSEDNYGTTSPDVF